MWLPRFAIAWKFFIIGASCDFYGQWNYLYLGLIFITAPVDFTFSPETARRLWCFNFQRNDSTAAR